MRANMIRFFLIFSAMGNLAGCARDEGGSAAGPLTPILKPFLRDVPTPAPCASVPLSDRTFSYCARQGPAGTGPNAKLIYFMHGLGQSADVITSNDAVRALLDSLAKVAGDGMPTIISISLGADGVFADLTQQVVDLLPSIEAKVAPGSQTPVRISMGASMGGHNSLRLAGQAPEKFRSIVALCAAVGTFNAYDPAAVADYEKRNESVIDRKALESALDAFKHTIKTSEQWAANNPFRFLQAGAYDKLPVFLSVGRSDQYGFLEGNREFKGALEKRAGASVEFHEVEGPHCVFDPVATIKFIVTQLKK